jgi:hypothetical protein
MNYFANCSSRLLFSLFLAANYLVAHAASPSSCPPVIGEKAMMLSSLQTIGTNRRMAQLCGVAPKAFEKRVQEEVETLKPCLNESGIS